MAESNLAWRRPFVMFACLVQTFISSGLIFGFSVMFEELTDVFNISIFKNSTIQGICSLVSFGGGILWIWPRRHLGLGLSMACGALLSCLGFASSSLAPNFQTVMICTGIICGVGLSIGVIGPFAVVCLLYNMDASLPITVLTIAVCAGQITMPYIYRVLLEHFSWAGAFIFLAGITLQGLPCGFFIHHSNRLLVKRDDNNVKSSICDKGLCMNPVIWIFIACFALLYGTANLEMWFLVDQMLSHGHSQRFATTLRSIQGFANLFGRISSCFMKMKRNSYPSVYNMFYICPMIALGHTLVILLQALDEWIFAACVILGFATGLLNAFTPVIVYDLVNDDEFLQAYLQLNVATDVGNLVIIYLAGKIRDMNGEYDFVYEFGIVVSLLLTLVFMIIAYTMSKRDKKRQSELLHQYDCHFKTYKSLE